MANGQVSDYMYNDNNNNNDATASWMMQYSSFKELRVVNKGA